MPTVKNKRSSAFAALAMLLVGLTFFGCGGSGSSSSGSNVDLTSGTLASCLKQGGAKFATDAGELDFFSAAETDDSASMFATYLDTPTKLFVQQWGDGDDPREWLLWQAQPFDEERTPVEIVESPSSGGYVAYAESPSQSQGQSLEACTDVKAKMQAG